MVVHRKISPRWAGERCIVAASGPSFDKDIAEKIRRLRWLGWRVIAVNDAFKLLPSAEVLYGADNQWWEHHGAQGAFAKFLGEKWACHAQENTPQIGTNDKRDLASRYGLNLLQGRDGDEFSFDPEYIRYGHNSGFQAINLALLFGCTRIVLVGFDMRHVHGQAHFFGDHPRELRTSTDDAYRSFVPRFERAAKKLPKHISIVNATPGSALKCFPMLSLDEATAERDDGCVSSDRTELQPSAG